MDIARDITLIAHFLGLAMMIGPFLLQMRQRNGYAFNWLLTGATIQLVTGSLLVGLAEMRLADNPDEAVNHVKIGVKLGLALIAFIAAFIGYRRQKKGATGASERPLMPFFHTAGGLAVIEVFIAVLWPGVVMG